MSEDSDRELAESETVWNSHSSSHSYGLQGLSDRAERVLRFIYSNPPEKVSIREISESTELSDWDVRKGRDELENKAYLEVSGTNQSTTYSLTPPAENILKNSGRVTAENSHSTSHSRDVEISSNVHDLAYRLPFSEKCLISQEDREVVLEKFEDLSLGENGEDLVGEWERFHFRISGESVVVYDKGEYHGLSPTFLKNHAIQELEDLRSYLQEKYSLRFEDRSIIQASIFSQDVAIEDHPIVVAIKRSPEVSLERKWVGEADDGDHRLQVDLSHGEIGELEETMRGPESSDKPLQEEDLQFELDDLARRVSNKRATRFLREFGEYLEEKVSGDLDLRRSSSQDSGSFSHTGGLCFEVDKEASLSEEGSVDLSDVWKYSSGSLSVTRSVSEESHSDKAERFESSSMSVSENFEDLDVRELPGTVLQDSQGRNMRVWYLEGLEASEEEEEEKEIVVVLRREDRVRRVPYEELKSWVSEGAVEIVEA